jgi:hypothetical protein
MPRNRFTISQWMGATAVLGINIGVVRAFLFAESRPKTSVIGGFFARHPSIFRLSAQASPRGVSFSSERFSEFLRLGSCLVS